MIMFTHRIEYTLCCNGKYTMLIPACDPSAYALSVLKAFSVVPSCVNVMPNMMSNDIAIDNSLCNISNWKLLLRHA